MPGLPALAEPPFALTPAVPFLLSSNLLAPPSFVLASEGAEALLDVGDVRDETFVAVAVDVVVVVVVGWTVVTGGELNGVVLGTLALSDSGDNVDGVLGLDGDDGDGAAGREGTVAAVTSGEVWLESLLSSAFVGGLSSFCVDSSVGSDPSCCSKVLKQLRHNDFLQAWGSNTTHTGHTVGSSIVLGFYSD